MDATATDIVEQLVSWSTPDIDVDHWLVLMADAKAIGMMEEYNDYLTELDRQSTSLRFRGPDGSQLEVVRHVVVHDYFYDAKGNSEDVDIPNLPNSQSLHGAFLIAAKAWRQDAPLAKVSKETQAINALVTWVAEKREVPLKKEIAEAVGVSDRQLQRFKQFGKAYKAMKDKQGTRGLLTPQ